MEGFLETKVRKLCHKPQQGKGARADRKYKLISQKEKNHPYF
jgi:hypothetical protein